MVRRHMKRMAAPKSWPIERKGQVYVTRPLPGAHSLKYGMPLSFVLTDMLKYTDKAREIKKMMFANEVKVNAQRRKDPKFMVGLFDIISVSPKDNYRMLLNAKGKFYLNKLDDKESSLFIFKIRSKSMIKGGLLQLNLSSGKNIRMKQSEAKAAKYEVGDSIIISLPGSKITEHISLQQGCLVFMTSGAHIGKLGKVESVEKDKIIVKSLDDDSQPYQTLKSYAFVVGKNKSVITFA